MSQPLPARLRCQQEQPQLGRVSANTDTENAPDPLPINGCDPSPFPCWIMAIYEIFQDLRHQVPKAVVESFFLRIMLPMLRNHPCGI